MKKRGVWIIVLAVVAVVVLLGALGFGFLAMRMWGGRSGAMEMMHGDYGQMGDGYGADMPCEDADGGAVCTEAMSCGKFPMGGMNRMPYSRGMWGMHSGGGRHGSSFLTNLLLLALLVVGVWNLVRWNKSSKSARNNPDHTNIEHNTAHDAE